MQKRKAFILPYPVILSVCLHWEALFPQKAYTKLGPTELGDNHVKVEEGETSIQVFSEEAASWFREHFPEAKEVEVIWT